MSYFKIMNDLTNVSIRINFHYAAKECRVWGKFHRFQAYFYVQAIQVCIELEIYVNNKTIFMIREKREKKRSIQYFSYILNLIQSQ